MAKFRCRCSHVIVLVRTPAPEEYTLVPNGQLYDLAERANKEKVPFDEFFNHIDAVSKDVLRCPSCGRVWIRDGEGPEYWPYLAEKE